MPTDGDGAAAPRAARATNRPPTPRGLLRLPPMANPGPCGRAALCPCRSPAPETLPRFPIPRRPRNSALWLTSGRGTFANPGGGGHPRSRGAVRVSFEASCAYPRRPTASRPWRTSRRSRPSPVRPQPVLEGGRGSAPGLRAGPRWRSRADESRFRRTRSPGGDQPAALAHHQHLLLEQGGGLPNLEQRSAGPPDCSPRCR